jgi:hypothetical protein
MKQEVKFDLPFGACAPDIWDDSRGVSLPLDHVISRDRQGKTLSYVRDFVWDMTDYTARQRISRLCFWFWRDTSRTIEAVEITPPRVAIMRELQYLMFLRIYRSERILAVRTLQHISSSLNVVARFAYENECSVREVFERTQLMDACIAELPGSRAGDFIKWLNFLGTLDPARELGFELATPKRLDELVQKAKEYRDNQEQHVPLPTRTYLHLIQGLANELNSVESALGRVQVVVREALTLHRQHKARGRQGGAEFGPELLATHGLTEVLTDTGFEASLKGLGGLLTHWQRICKLQIHVFSGMRDEEVVHLPYHCIQYENAGHGRKHSLIVGITTKLAGGRNKRTRWVTTADQGFRAIRIAQSIANMIYECIGVTPSADDAGKDQFPLFLSTGYLPWVNQKAPSKSRGLAPSRALRIEMIADDVLDMLLTVTTPADIEELEAIDPFRDWTSDGVAAVGKRWHLRTHQLRRSLALYANASGLVKSSSLRRQLQHITGEMSYYYGRGSIFAKNFLEEDPRGYGQHIAVEWQDTEQEAQYLAFTRDVLNSDEPLWGPGGVFYDLKKQRGEVLSEQEVRAQLKMGRMAYKSHPLGGCTNVGNCDKQKGLRLTAGICASEKCKSLIGKHSSIIKIIPIQRGILSRLHPESIAYAMEKEELDILESTAKEWSRTKPAARQKGATHE